ncbi:MAG TPA: hypothetical protein VNU44_05170 [Bryobacteraceae bacterium]|jgi:hypothetical protein|nr:hypothetical protein [Bryobacteraceae bacterium]
MRHTPDGQYAWDQPPCITAALSVLFVYWCLQFIHLIRSYLV